MLADKHRADFLLDFENHTFCNHGSYGAAPKVWTDFRTMKTCSFIPHWCLNSKISIFQVVCDRKNELLMEMESHPDTWFRQGFILSQKNFQISDFYTIRFRKNLSERQHYRVTLNVAKLLLILFMLHMTI